MNWRPIETAPKDGTHFLAWVEVTADEYDEDHLIRKGIKESYAVIGYYVFGGFMEFPYRGTFVQNMKWKNWQPLPNGPQTTE